MWSQPEAWWNELSKCKAIITKKCVILVIYYDNKYCYV